MRLATRLAATTLLLAATFTAGAVGCEATANPPPLFRETARQPAAPPPDSPRVLRARYVEVDFSALGGENLAPASAPARLLLNLFPDVVLVAERNDVQPTATGRGFIWTGHVEGAPASVVTLVAEDGVVAGRINAGGALYTIGYAGDGVHIVRELNAEAFPPD